MNNTQRLAHEYQLINDFFIENSYEHFECEWNKLILDYLVVIDDGIIKGKTLSYFIYLLDESALKDFIEIENHEGIWTFTTKAYLSVERHNHLADLVTRVFTFQFIDDVYSMEFKRGVL